MFEHLVSNAHSAQAHGTVAYSAGRVNNDTSVTMWAESDHISRESSRTIEVFYSKTDFITKSADSKTLDCVFHYTVYTVYVYRTVYSV